MSDTVNKSSKQEKMVEEMGIFFEKSGFTPLHGRVFAYLLLAEPPHKDFYEIQDFVKASKSSISAALKFLMAEELVEYITFSGDRKRYFQVNMKGWMDNTKQRILQTPKFNAILKEVIAERADSKYLAFTDDLKMMSDFYTEISEVLSQFVERWENKRK